MDGFGVSLAQGLDSLTHLMMRECLPGVTIYQPSLTQPHQLSSHPLSTPRLYKDLTKVMDEYGGWGRVSGVVHDKEAVNDSFMRKLQQDHPHIIDTSCQAHGERHGGRVTCLDGQCPQRLNGLLPSLLAEVGWVQA